MLTAARNRLARLLHNANRLRLWITRPLTVGVRVILLRDGQVLLVRHTYQAGWMLPGGGVHKGETLEEAARREAVEETGAECSALELVGAYTNFKESRSDHVMVFVCRSFTLSKQRSDRFEIADCAFFPLNGLPDDLLPGHRRRIEGLSLLETPHCGLW